jgi:hypothetical protein
VTGYGRPQPPGPWPSRAVRLAVRLLPAGPARERYRHEFIAELYGMPHSRQVRHVLGLLARSVALRSAVDRDRQPSTLEVSMPVLPPRAPLLCRTHLHHKWELTVNPDGDDYLRCAACGKDRYDVDRVQPGLGNFGGGIGGGMSGAG